MRDAMRRIAVLVVLHRWIWWVVAFLFGLIVALLSLEPLPCKGQGWCPSYRCFSAASCGPGCECLQLDPPHPGQCVRLDR